MKPLFQETMRLIIAGPRNFEDYDYVKKVLDKEFPNPKLIKVVFSGACGVDKYTESHSFSAGDPCDGVDNCGEMWAVENDIRIKRFIADWTEYGRSAGPIRNRKMAKLATHAMVFRYKNPKKCPGSMNMIAEAEAQPLLVKTHIIEE